MGAWEGAATLETHASPVAVLKALAGVPCVLASVFERLRKRIRRPPRSISRFHVENKCCVRKYLWPRAGHHVIAFIGSELPGNYRSHACIKIPNRVNIFCLFLPADRIEYPISRGEKVDSFVARKIGSSFCFCHSRHFQSYGPTPVATKQGTHTKSHTTIAKAHAESTKKGNTAT